MAKNGVPIATCRREEQPADTERRRSIRTSDNPDHVWGWIVREPAWPENVWHISACHDGRAVLLKYVMDASLIWPTVKAYFDALR